MKLMITGPQGSGKTTQAKAIAEKLSLCMVKLGELLRVRAQLNDQIGQSLKSDLDKGVLVDNKIVADILKDELSKPKCAGGYVVDGYPRSLTQLQEFNPEYDQVVYLDLPLNLAVDRLRKRGRTDDTPEAIKQRLDWFEEDTKKVVDYYDKKGILTKVNAAKSEQEVTDEILSRLKNHG